MSIGRIEMIDGKKQYVRYATLGGGTNSSTSYDLILENNSWEKIATASERGIANKLWSLGDEKDGYVIVGFDHDDLADGSRKAGITFCTNDREKTKSGAWAMNDGSSFVRYDNSLAFQNLEELFDELTEINPYIKQVSKKIRNSDMGSGYINCACRLFLFSISEMKNNFVATDDYDEPLKNEGEYYNGFPLEYRGYFWTRSARWTSAFIKPHATIYYTGSDWGTAKYETVHNSYRYGFCI